MAFKDLREFISALEDEGELRRVDVPGQPRSGDHRDRRPRREGRRSRAAVRERRRLDHARRRQPVRLPPAHGPRPRRRGPRRADGARPQNTRPGPGPAVRARRKAEDAGRRRRHGEDVSPRPSPGRRARTSSSSATTSTSTCFRPSSAGRWTQVASSPCPWSSAATRRQGGVTSGPTACRSTTGARPGCTGSRTRSVPATTGWAKSGGATALTSPSRSAETPSPSGLAPFRCPPTWTR